MLSIIIWSPYKKIKGYLFFHPPFFSCALFILQNPKKWRVVKRNGGLVAKETNHLGAKRHNPFGVKSF